MQKICDVRSFRNKAPKVSASCYIDRSAVVIGDVTLSDDVSIWPLVVIRGDVNHIKIGCRSNIQDGSVLHVARPTDSNPPGHPLIIGEDVTIAHKVMLHGCTINDRVLVGMNSTIMDGAVIASDTIIGAGSLVPPNKELERGCLYMGTPVKKIRSLSEEETAAISVSSENYVQLKADYL